MKLNTLKKICTTAVFANTVVAILLAMSFQDKLAEDGPLNLHNVDFMDALCMSGCPWMWAILLSILCIGTESKVDKALLLFNTALASACAMAGASTLWEFGFMGWP